MNITFIGGGNMARSLIGGMVARGSASNAFAVVDPSADARATIAARYGVATFAAIEPPALAHARDRRPGDQASKRARRFARAGDAAEAPGRDHHRRGHPAR
jgi:hypothetical protein